MRPGSKIILFLTSLIVLGTNPARAADAVPRVALLELYTSEGCSSCPPADRWVSALPAALVPQKLVVLAFHVDYWDYLGWKDRFSQRRFSQRQQDAVRITGLRTAYTPQLLLNGHDYRDRHAIDTEVARINSQATDIKLLLTHVKKASTLHVSARLGTAIPHEDKSLGLFIAIYENKLETDVRAGENNGERLQHDYVVRELIGPLAITSSTTSWTQKIPLQADWKIGNLGVAAFIQSQRSGEILQATAQPIQ